MTTDFRPYRLKICTCFALILCSLPGLAQKISSYKELTATKVEGKDFEIKTRSLTGDALVMAIHGGTLESGTTELADATAGDKNSFYSFIGLTSDYEGLHLTSTNFDEPQLSTLTQTAKKCLSLHGLKDDEIDFCVGGANARKRKSYLSLLAQKFPKWRSCELCCPPNSGTAKDNVVNRCKVDGVQIEMGQSVRTELKKNPIFLKQLSNVLQEELAKD